MMCEARLNTPNLVEKFDKKYFALDQEMIENFFIWMRDKRECGGKVLIRYITTEAEWCLRFFYTNDFADQ